MALKCAKIPNYDTQSCCKNCHAGKESVEYRVMINKIYYFVCCEAWKFAKKHRIITSRVVK